MTEQLPPEAPEAANFNTAFAALSGGTVANMILLLGRIAGELAVKAGMDRNTAGLCVMQGGQDTRDNASREEIEEFLGLDPVTNGVLVFRVLLEATRAAGRDVEEPALAVMLAAIRLLQEGRPADQVRRLVLALLDQALPPAQPSGSSAPFPRHMGGFAYTMSTEQRAALERELAATAARLPLMPKRPGATRRGAKAANDSASPAAVAEGLAAIGRFEDDHPELKPEGAQHGDA